jgi:hypothetical protein
MLESLPLSGHREVSLMAYTTSLDPNQSPGGRRDGPSRLTRLCARSQPERPGPGLEPGNLGRLVLTPSLFCGPGKFWGFGFLGFFFFSPSWLTTGARHTATQNTRATTGQRLPRAHSGAGPGPAAGPAPPRASVSRSVPQAAPHTEGSTGRPREEPARPPVPGRAAGSRIRTP